MQQQMMNNAAPAGDKQVAVLAKVRGFYESAVRHPVYNAWREEAQRGWQFYEGQQWTEQERDQLQQYGQPPIVINKIAPKIDNIAGTEVAGRTRIIYRSRSGAKDEEQTAKALSDLALYVAERSDQALELSQVFRAGLVTGLGWLDVGVQEASEGLRIFNRAENELDVVFDPYARRADLSDARFVARERWLDEAQVRALFPQQAGVALKQLAQAGIGGGQPLAEVRYTDPERELLKVVEVQYVQSEKQYRVATTAGRELLTFDREAAYAEADAEVTSQYAPRVYVAYFAGAALLAHKPLPYDHQQFTLVPYVYKRERTNGQPYGLVRSAMDAQRELNKRRSKAMHLLNTAQVIADVDAVEDPNQLAKEAARPDGLILKRPGKDLRIIRNSDLASSQVSVMEQASRDLQEVMGVFDESLGKQSNATSGVAISVRQQAGTLNQMFAFDALRRTKKQLGEQILWLVRQYFTAAMVIRITDDLHAPRVVHLNPPAADDVREPSLSDTSNAAPLRVVDVASGAFDVHVEEVRDVLSSRELELQQLQLLLQAGVPVPPKMLVAATSLRNKEQLQQALQGTQQGEDAPREAASCAVLERPVGAEQQGDQA